jgi:hypothetical protein
MKTYTTPRTTTRKTLRTATIGLVVVISAAILGIFICQTALSSPRITDVVRGGLGDVESGVKLRVDDRAAPGVPPDVSEGSPPRTEEPITEDDGVLPDGITVFDDAFPGVANLDPNLLWVLRAAAMDAAANGIEFYVTSGWRSPEYQNQLLREAVFEYGSEAEAARWVATADTSAHVSGNAADIGSYDAIAWLSEHGAGYGLCQIYGNEPWHFELSSQAIDHGCPPLYADPTHDPRMQQ